MLVHYRGRSIAIYVDACNRSYDVPDSNSRRPWTIDARSHLLGRLAIRNQPISDLIDVNEALLPRHDEKQETARASLAPRRPGRCS